MTMPGKAQLQCEIDRAVFDRLAVEAERRFMGRRRLVEAALCEWLARHEGESLPGESPQTDGT